MLQIMLVGMVFLVLLLMLSISVVLGRRCGMRLLQSHQGHKLEVVSVAESAVFGLLGLMIAFTFSGAYDRYEMRKLHILEEANAFKAAYQYVDLTPIAFQPTLRNEVRQYLDLHITTFRDIPHLNKVHADIQQASALQESIWQTAVAATKQDTNGSMTELLLPALSKLFDVAETGINMTFLHPPAAVFILLIGLAVLGGFLIGYNASETKQKHTVHISSYILLTALIIFMIINLEFPRVGFIRINSFDQMLFDVRDTIEQR